MSQSSAIVAFLLAAFVLFIAAKGNLPKYTAVLWGNTKAATPSGGSSGGGGVLGTVSGAVKTGSEIASVAGLI